MEAKKFNGLSIYPEEPEDREKAVAEASLDAVYSNAVVAAEFSRGIFGEINLDEAARCLRVKTYEVRSGDLSGLEDLLTAQAVTLNTIFSNLVRRSHWQMDKSVETAERYMRLALKVQAQTRVTIETIAMVKRPPPVFAKAANIANGPQQVNYGVNFPCPGAGCQAEGSLEEIKIGQNELLDGCNVESMDPGASQKAGGGNSEMEAMGAIHRAAKRKRKTGLKSER